MSNMALYSPECRQAESKKRVSGGQWDRSWFYRFGIGSGKLQKLQFRAVFASWEGIIGSGAMRLTKVDYTASCLIS